MAGTNKQDVNLNITGDASGATKSFAEAQAALAKLTASLADQAKAAANGDDVSKKLQLTLAELSKVLADSAGAQRAITSFDKAGEKLATMSEQAAAAKAKLDTFRASMEETEKATAKQVREQTNLEKAFGSATTRVDNATAAYARASERLQKLGIDSAKTAEVSKALDESRAQASIAAANVRTAQLEGIDVRERKAKDAAVAAENARALKQQQEADAAAEAARVAKAEAIGKFNARLAQLARERVATEAKATADENARALKQQQEADAAAEAARVAKAEAIGKFNARLAQLARERVAAEAKATADEKKLADEALAQFQAVADRAIAANRGFSTLGTAASRPAAAPSAADAVRAATDADGVSRTSLPGAEADIAKQAAAFDAAKGSAKDYATQLDALRQSQATLLASAKLVDQFNAQKIASDSATASFGAARAEVDRIAAEMKAAKVPTTELADALKKAETEVQRTGAAAAKEATSLESMRAALGKAGIAETELAGVQARLTTSAETAAAATKKLEEALGKSGGQQPGFLGLRRYELQNLGYELSHVVDQVNSGSSLGQALSQQVGKAFEVFETHIGGIKGLLFTVIPAIAAVVVAVKVLQEAFEEASAIRKFQANLTLSVDGARYTATQLVELQKELRSLGASFDDAGKAIQGFISGNVDPSKLEAFAVTAQKLTDITGISLVDAQKRLTEAFTGNFESIEKLDREYNFLSVSQSANIRELMDQGHNVEALNLAFGIFRDKVSDANTQAVSPMTTALRSLKEGWHDFLDTLAHSETLTWIIDKLGKLLSLISDANKVTREGAPGGATPSLQDTAAAMRRTSAGIDLERLQQQRDALSLANDKLGNGPSFGRLNNDNQIAALDKQIAALRALTVVTTEAASAGDREVQVGKARVAGSAALTASLKSQAELARQLREETDALSDRQNDTPEKIRARSAERRRKELERAARDAQGQPITPDVLAGIDAKTKAEEDRDMARFMKREQQQFDRQQRAGEADDRRQEAAENKRRKAEESLQAALLQLQSQGDKAATASLESRLEAVKNAYSKIATQLSEAQRVGVSSVGGRSISEFQAQVAAAEKEAENAATLKFYEESVNNSLKARSQIYRDQQAQLVAGTTDVRTAFDVIGRSTGTINVDLKKSAEAALVFARALNGAKPSPALEAFIAKMQATLNGTAGKGVGGDGDVSATGTSAQAMATLKAGETGMNQLIAERNELEKEQNELVTRGLATRSEADEKIQKAYAATAPEIEKQIALLMQQAQLLRDTGQISQTAYDAFVAKLRVAQSETSKMTTFQKQLHDTVQNAFVNGVTSFFEKSATAMGKFLTGTGKLKDVFREVGQAFAQFASDFLKQIAEMILKAYLLQAIQSAFGFGSTESVTAIKHSGGVVGSDSTFRPVPTAAFAYAPRFHNGTVVGLAPDEQAAVLQKGEEVLSKGNPRNILNGGGRSATPSMGSPLKQVLVFDEKMIPAAMSSSGGEQVTLTHIKNNAEGIRSILKV